jgi:hypothetical protein
MLKYLLSTSIGTEQQSIYIQSTIWSTEYAWNSYLRAVLLITYLQVGTHAIAGQVKHRYLVVM